MGDLMIDDPTSLSLSLLATKGRLQQDLGDEKGRKGEKV
jgi:hypothetical protein